MDKYQGFTGLGPVREIALAAFIAVGVIVLAYRLYANRYPKNLPRIGEKDGVSWKAMREKFATDCTAVFEDAYENYSKKGKAVLIPVFGPQDEVILPPTALQWLCKQPDNVASSAAAQIDAIGLEHSLGYKFAHDPWGGWLIKTDLNSALETVCAVINDELEAAFEANFGHDSKDWKELDLFPVCRKIGGRATLRFTLGDSPEGRRLCRDEAFVQSCYDVLDAMLDLAGYIAEKRKFLRPYYGRYAARAMPPKLKDLEQRFEPLLRERLDIIEKQDAGHDVKVPRDLIQMMLRYAVQERPQEARNLGDMTKRLALSNFGTMHQTIITLHNLFLNIIGSDEEYKTTSVLCGEVTKVLGEGGDTCNKQWTRAKVASMTKGDSVVRETLRVNSFIGRTVQRLVVAPEGLVTPDGVRLPYGTMVSILAHQSQTDKETFPDPFKYDPFRFSRLREAAADKETGKPGLNNLSCASTSHDYLPFSHGRHACPGRFLVDFELKMIMSYAVMNYDMKFPESYEGKRPPNTWFVGFGIPPLEAKIQVKRKESAN